MHTKVRYLLDKLGEPIHYILIKGLNIMVTYGTEELRPLAQDDTPEGGEA